MSLKAIARFREEAARTLRWYDFVIATLTWGLFIVLSGLLLDGLDQEITGLLGVVFWFLTLIVIAVRRASR
jgi:hypothetical protein